MQTQPVPEATTTNLQGDDDHPLAANCPPESINESVVGQSSLTDDISNVSIISGEVPSYIMDTASGGAAIGELFSESNSRPLSRNLTTSCISTTATKDGIEGKRLHRRGPTAFANSIIQGMFVDSKFDQESGGDKLNMANIELHNTIFKRDQSDKRGPHVRVQQMVDSALEDNSSLISLRSVNIDTPSKS